MGRRAVVVALVPGQSAIQFSMFSCGLLHFPSPQQLVFPLSFKAEQRRAFLGTASVPCTEPRSSASITELRMFGGQSEVR